MTLENISEKVEKLSHQVKRLDKEVFDLNSKSEVLRVLLMKIINDQTISANLLVDIHYSILKKDLSGEERAGIGFLLLKIEREHKAGLEVPSLDAFHAQLLQVLKVEEHEKANYPVEISKQLLLAHLNNGEFPLLVAKEILDKV